MNYNSLLGLREGSPILFLLDNIGPEVPAKKKLGLRWLWILDYARTYHYSLTFFVKIYYSLAFSSWKNSLALQMKISGAIARALLRGVINMLDDNVIFSHLLFIPTSMLFIPFLASLLAHSFSARTHGNNQRNVSIISKKKCMFDKIYPPKNQCWHTKHCKINAEYQKLWSFKLDGTSHV